MAPAPLGDSRPWPLLGLLVCAATRFDRQSPLPGSGLVAVVEAVAFDTIGPGKPRGRLMTRLTVGQLGDQHVRSGFAFKHLFCGVTVPRLLVTGDASEHPMGVVIEDAV